MKKFRQAIVDALIAVGFDVTCGYQWQFAVNGIVIEPEQTKYGARMLGANFTIKEDGSFDLDRAVGVVLREMPKRLKAKREQEAYMAAHLQLQGLTVVHEAATFKVVSKGEVLLAPSRLGLLLIMPCKDVAEAEAMHAKLAHEDWLDESDKLAAEQDAAAARSEVALNEAS